MSDDRLGEDVRIPQAASIATNRRKTMTISVTTTSQFFQLRDPAAAAAEVYFTMYAETASVNIWWHGGSHVAPNLLPVATANDWPLPPQTERNYKLGAGETHIAIVSSAPATVKVGLSSD
jgi:hypothetical protein